MNRFILGLAALLVLVGTAQVKAAYIISWNWDAHGLLDEPEGNDFVDVAAGYIYSLALRQDGAIVAWGGNDYDQLDVPAGNDFVDIAAGGYHGLALREDGSIVGWGRNDYGQSDPPPGGGNDFVDIAAGDQHSLALRQDGSIVAWGYNVDDQDCNNLEGNGFVDIAAGSWHSLALRQDGAVVGCGKNNFGQRDCLYALGNDFVKTGGGEYHSLALRQDGSLVACGANFYGQGDPPAGNDFVDIAAGHGHNLALRQDGSIVAWGYDYHDAVSPLPERHDFVDIAAGQQHNVALIEPPTLTSISNGFWNLPTTWDDGTAIPSADYSTLVDGHTVTLDADGEAFSLAIREDGAVVVGPGRTLTIVVDLQLEAGKLAIAAGGTADVSGYVDGGSANAAIPGYVVIDPAAGLEIALAETSFTGSLTVDGNADLAGDLDFTLCGSSPFQAGAHSLITYGSYAGTFDTVTDLGPYVTGDGLTYGDNVLTLTIDHDLLIGDLDLDGDVDFFDYIATSNNFGETEGMRFQDGDMDNDGDVDFFDYITVSNHFGDSLPATAGAAEVPEPSTFILLAMGAVSLLAYGWRRRRR